MQQRSDEKITFPNLWTNTCCSHPKPGEETKDAVVRRLHEEMGFTCEVEQAFEFSYIKEFDNGLTENEYDHVFVAFAKENPIINPDEVHAWKWVPWNVALHEMEHYPEEYTYWHRLAYPKVIIYLKEKGFI